MSEVLVQDVKEGTGRQGSETRVVSLERHRVYTGRVRTGRSHKERDLVRRGS